VVLVDDQQLVRAGIAFILSTEPGIDVASEAANGELGLVAVADHRPDVVLMDVRMPVLDGLQATQRIRDADGPPVLVLTTFDDDDLVLEALRSGASGFLLKETRPADLLAAIGVVAGGEALLAPRVTRRMIERFTMLTSSPGPVNPLAQSLTDREREVLAAVAAGRSNREIAETLAMGYGTVKTHVSHLLTKLECRDRAQLVVFAYEQRIAVPSARPPG
jgi:DNA-binding NarL/FixJ family response regulator